MKPLGPILAAAAAVAAAACAQGGSNDATPALEQGELAGPGSDRQAAPPSTGTEARRGGQAGDGESRPKAADVPVAGVGDPPADRSGDDADQCGASRYQWLLGRPRSAIPASPSGASWRIACTSCPITQDYSPARLNIFYDAETERIEEVRCG